MLNLIGSIRRRLGNTAPASITTTLVATATVALAGCGENWFANTEATLVSQPDVFQAVELEFENEAGETIDLLNEGGRFELVLDEEQGVFESDFGFQDTEVDVSGTFELRDGEIVFSDDPFENDEVILQRSFEFLRADGVLFLEDPTSAFDVDNDGEEEVAELSIRLESVD